MSGNLAGIIITVVIAAICAWAFYRRAHPPDSAKSLPGTGDWRDVPIGAIQRSYDQKRVSPLGITVYGGKDQPITDKMLTEADEAYNERKDNAVRESEGTYVNIPPPTKIDILLPKFGCVPSAVQQVPAFLVRADRSFEAGIYDQHYSIKYDPPVPDKYNSLVLNYSEPDDIAVIYAAEMLVSLSTEGSSVPGGPFTEPRDQWVVCPGQYWKEGVGNGFDHVIIAHCDGGDYFDQTNGPTHVHPLTFRRIPDSTAAGFAATGDVIAPKAFVLTAPIPLTPVR